LLLTICALAAVGCSAAGPQSLELTSTSSDAVLLLYVSPARVDYTINIVSYDAAAQQTSENPLAGRAAMAVHAIVPPHFVAQKIASGTYAFQSFEQRGAFALCFGGGTLAFTVKPGQVLLLGALDQRKHEDELGQNILAQNDQLSDGLVLHHYFGNISSPQIIDPASDTATMANAKAFVATSMPNVRGEITPAVYRKAVFGTGYSLTGKRLCGGYFKDAAKTAAQ
jgi:hypothetical protein